jgi:hypothetical protein
MTKSNGQIEDVTCFFHFAGSTGTGVKIISTSQSIADGYQAVKMISAQIDLFFRQTEFSC